jgi:hypothetical protein
MQSLLSLLILQRFSVTLLPFLLFKRIDHISSFSTIPCCGDCTWPGRVQEERHGMHSNVYKLCPWQWYMETPNRPRPISLFDRLEWIGLPLQWSSLEFVFVVTLRFCQPTTTRRLLYQNNSILVKRRCGLV